MFIEFIYQIFGGCSNPLEYVTAFLLFYMLMDIIVRIIGIMVGSTRRNG